MALEDLTGADKFISNLVPTNPVGSDDKRDGDNHIRGIKNVLRNTFPNLNGPMTATDEDLSTIAGKVNRAGDTMSGSLTTERNNVAGGNWFIGKNRGTLAQHGNTYNVAGLVGNGFRDIADPAYIAGVLIERTATNSGASSKGSIVFGISYVGEADPNTLIEKARIDDTGLLINRKTPISGGIEPLQVSGANSTGIDYCMMFGGATLGNNTVAQRFISFTSGGVVGSVQFSTTATMYNTSSDARLKAKIIDSQLGVLDLDKLRVREFEFKAEPGVRRVGFIAQELHEVYPEAVTVGTDERDEAGNLMLPWAVDYARLVPLLVAALQDVRRDLAELRDLAGL